MTSGFLFPVKIHPPLFYTQIHSRTPPLMVYLPEQDGDQLLPSNSKYFTLGACEYNSDSNTEKYSSCKYYRTLVWHTLPQSLPAAFLEQCNPWSGCLDKYKTFWERQEGGKTSGLSAIYLNRVVVYTCLGFKWEKRRCIIVKGPVKQQRWCSCVFMDELSAPFDKH